MQCVVVSKTVSETVPAPKAKPRNTWVAAPSHRWFLVELLALTGFAITQPLLTVFGQSVDTFVFRKSSPTEVVLFALGIAVIPALAVWLVTTLISALVPRVSLIVKSVAVAGIASLVALHTGKELFGLHHRRLVAGVIVISIICGLLYARSRLVHDFLRFGVFGQAMFVVLFVFSSTVTPFLFGDTAGRAKAVSGGKKVSIAMLVFDEWPTVSFIGPDGDINAKLFPNLARLAKTSNWYRNATGISNATTYAVPSMLTGRLQKLGATPLSATQPDNLFSLVRSTHKLKVSEAVTSMCGVCSTKARSGSLSALFGDAKSVLKEIVSPIPSNTDITARFREETETPGIDTRIDTKVSRRKLVDHALNGRPKTFGNFVNSFEKGEVPTLHFLHILFPHVPHRYVPSGRSYDFPIPEIGRQAEVWVDGPYATMVGRQRQLLQSMYADKLVGQLLDRLVTTGLMDSTAIVITADHGIAFDPGAPARGVTNFPLPASTYPELLWSPLFMKAPNQRVGERSDANVMTIDILPTLASFMGWKVPFSMDGKVAGTRTESTKLFQRGYGDRVGARVDPPIKYDGAADLKIMLSKNLDSWTDSQDSAWQPWRIGEFGPLVGTTFPGARGRTSPLTVTLLQRDALAKVDPDSGSIPAIISGTASRAGTIAVVLRGKIVGISPVVKSIGKLKWVMMLPESMLGKGRNDLAFYEVTGTMPSLQYAQLAT